MNKIRYTLLLLALTMVGATLNTMSAKNGVVSKIYIFGFAASFNDTIVHITEVQELDSAWIDSKTEFLQGRDNYSYQLRSYLSEKLKMPQRTCIVMFDKDRNKLEKAYLKLKKKYAGSNRNQFDMRLLPATEFKFTSIDMSEAVEEVSEQPAAKAPKEKATKKKKKDKKS